MNKKLTTYNHKHEWEFYKNDTWQSCRFCNISRSTIGKLTMPIEKTMKTLINKTHADNIDEIKEKIAFTANIVGYKDKSKRWDVSIDEILDMLEEGDVLIECIKAGFSTNIPTIIIKPIKLERKV